MQPTRPLPGPEPRLPIGRLAGAALALGGFGATVLIVGRAGATTAHAANVSVSTTKNSRFGTILVSNGRTLYTLKASKTACSTACLAVWPELVLPKGVTKASAGTGVSAAKLGTVKRPGGKLQVTYGGRALYWFSGDTKSGQVNGDVTDTWGKWSAVVTVAPSTSSSSGSSGNNTGTGGIAF